MKNGDRLTITLCYPSGRHAPRTRQRPPRSVGFQPGDLGSLRTPFLSPPLHLILWQVAIGDQADGCDGDWWNDSDDGGFDDGLDNDYSDLMEKLVSVETAVTTPWLNPLSVHIACAALGRRNANLAD